MKIPYTKPSITETEVEYADQAARYGWGSKCYEYIDQFEVSFRDYVGTRYAIATSSCTGALHMGLYALGIGCGDEVIVADTNWIATASPVVHLGGTPVFVDILHDTWCIDPNKVEAAITPRTKAIIATHIYGNLCEMEVLLEIGDKHGVPIIEDAAEGIGSKYKGMYAGSMGHFGVFSFHGTKTLTTGEGGMFVTDDEDLYEKVLTASNHGRSRYEQKQFWPESVGFKYRMSNIQAAIGCAQLSRVESLVARKREILELYRHHLENPPEVRLNPEPRSGVNGAWMPTITLSPSTNVTADDLQKALLQCDIDARVFFSPLSALPMFVTKPENENAYDIPSRALNLPSYHDMSFQEQQAVIDVVQDVIRHSRRFS